ncbi:hypothetical protein C8R46DRAFT_1117354 [Mycena filopes]|nr:hypothetical protein C8R46DRAFT_1117354 [Mycena filopes]
MRSEHTLAFLCILLPDPSNRKRIMALEAALGLLIFLELFRAERFAPSRAYYGVPEHRAQAGVASFLQLADLAAAYIFLAVVLSYFLAALRFLGLLLWTRSFWAATRECTVGKVRDTPPAVLYRRRRLFKRGAEVMQRVLSAVWLLLLVAWTSDQLHYADAAPRPLSAVNLGPWALFAPTIALRDGLEYVWKKVLVMVVRHSDYAVPQEEHWRLSTEWNMEGWEDMYERWEEDRREEEALPVYTAEKV